MKRKNFGEEDITQNLLDAGRLFASAGWEATKFIVKNTPKAVATIAQVKREIIDTVEEEYREFQKLQKEQELDAKILELKKRSAGKSEGSGNHGNSILVD